MLSYLEQFSCFISHIYETEDIGLPLKVFENLLSGNSSSRVLIMHQFLIRFLCFSLFLTICCSFYKSIRAYFRTFVNVVVSCMRVSFSKVVATKVNLFLVFMCILLFLNFFCPFLALPGDHYLQYPCSIIIIIIKIISIHNIHCYQQHHNHHHHCHQHHK